MSKVVIIGSGIGGLAAACLLAKDGHEVTVLEKNSDLGGRAGQFTEQGFTFSYGPTWYLMPDVFERFYELLDEKIEKHLDLERLDPMYKVFFAGSLLAPVEFSGNIGRDSKTFDLLEPRGGQKLREYLRACAEFHELAQKFIYRNYDSKLDLLGRENLSTLGKLNVLSNMNAVISQHFSNQQIKQILGYPAVFIGTNPYHAPAVYSLLNHAVWKQGVFAPKGGMYSLADSLMKVAKKRGLQVKMSSEAAKIITQDNRAKAVQLKTGEKITADIIISNAGLAGTERLIVPDTGSARARKKPWLKYSPSAVLIYLGIEGALPMLQRHNLVFTPDWPRQFRELARSKRFPNRPSLYVHYEKQARKNTYGLFMIVPTSRQIPYTDAGLDKFAEAVIDSLGQSIHAPDLKQRIIYKKIFAGRDFTERYNAHHGTMLGLSHTLSQTGPFRPQNKSKRVSGLYLVGADTVPGIGVPMCLISAELVANRIQQDLKR